MPYEERFLFNSLSYSILYGYLPFRLPHLSSLAALGVGEMLGFFFFAIYQQIVWS